MLRVNLRTLGPAVLCTIPLWVHAAFGDVTVRYQTTIKFGTSAPPQFKDQTAKFVNSMGQISLEMKNGRELSTMGRSTFLIDCTTQQMVLIDNEHHTFAKLAVADFAGQIAAAMPKPPEMSEEVRKAMPVMKTGIQKKNSGRIESIQGIQAEEREIVIDIEMSPPPAAGSQMPPAHLKMVSRPGLQGRMKRAEPGDPGIDGL